MKILLVILILVSVGRAETPTPKDPISDSLRIAYQTARADTAEAQANLQILLARQREVEAQINAACVETNQLAVIHAQTKQPICMAKEAPPPPPPLKETPKETPKK